MHDKRMCPEILVAWGMLSSEAGNEEMKGEMKVANGATESSIAKDFSSSLMADLLKCSLE